MKDENDRAMEGTLPADPAADAEPMPAPGAAALEELAPSVGSIIPDAVAQMLRRAMGEERPVPLPWNDLSGKMNGGLWPGCHVLVGNTGTGKSQFAIQAMLHAAREGVPCLYIGLELDRTSLVARLLGLIGDTEWSALYLGTVSLDHKTAPTIGGCLMEADRNIEELASLPIHLAEGDAFGWSYDRLEKSAEALKASYPKAKTMFVVLDYLQLVGSPEGVFGQPIRERIGCASYAAREVAKKHNAAVLLLSSTARQNYDLVGGHTPGKEKPAWEGPAGRMVGLGKESGEVEFSADSVLALIREPWTDGKRPTNGLTTMHLAIAKQRVGRTSWTELKFDGASFTEREKLGYDRNLRGRP